MISSRPTVKWLLSLLLIVAIAFGSLSTIAAGPGEQPGGPEIKLKYARFDPLRGEPGPPAELRGEPSDKAKYYLVQFTGPVLEGWKTQVEGLGGRVLDYVPDFSFVVKMDGRTRAQVNRLDFVRWVGLFHPAYKIAPGLEKKAGEIEIRLRIFEGESLAEPAAAVQSAGGRVLAGGGRSLRAEVSASELAKLARDDAVAWIEEYQPPQLANDHSRVIGNAATAWNDLSLYGSGQVVAVADTGLDNGSLSTVDLDFRGRVQAAFAWTRSGDWSDLNGHGTHVAGSVLGNGANSGSTPASHNYAGSFAGMAPEASLVMQSVGDSSNYLTLPADLNELFIQAYNAGARVHSNSWGGGSGGQYNAYSADVDEFVWNHPDMTILFAAGNQGADVDGNGLVDSGSVIPPSTAKNCIAVGAGEGDRPPGSGGLSSYTWSSWGFSASPLSSDPVSDNPLGMAAFSSRGPADDDRIKPDIVAPGTNIISVRSSASSSVGWGVYDSNYIYNGGTSMATPLSAGAATLVREYFVEKMGWSNPSAALIKAALLNGAYDMDPGQYGTGSAREMASAPNNVEGWGRLDLRGALLPSAPTYLHFVDNKAGLSTGVSAAYSLPVADGSVPLKVMLVWSDYPSSEYSSANLVNDLNLKVRAPDGTVYWGNGVTGGDWINNVEGVRVANPITGTYTITVTAPNVPQTAPGTNGQPFALAIAGGISTAKPTGTVAVNGGAAATSSRDVTLNLSYSDDAAQMSFSNNGQSWTAWQDVKAGRPWTLPAGEGEKTVYALFRSQSGVLSDTVTDTIILDVSPPSGSVVIDYGESSTNLITATLTLSATDASGQFGRYRAGNVVDGVINWTAAWTDYPSAGGTMTLTHRLANGPDGNRKVAVRFEDAAGNRSTACYDTIALDTAPELVSPAAGGTVTGTAPLLDWEVVPEAVKYKVVVSDPVAGVQVINDPNVTSTEYQVPAGKLRVNRTYKWKVHAYVYGRWSGPSEKWSFKTPSAAPGLTWPIGSPTITTTTPLLEWVDVAGAGKYWVKVVDTASGVVRIDKVIKDPVESQYQASPGELLPSRQYKWKVRANVEGFWGAWSELGYFRVSGMAPEQASPADGATDVATPVTLTWNSVEGAGRYEVVVRNKNTGTVVLRKVVIGSTSFEDSGVLKSGKLYEWRVRAKVYGNWGAFSPWWSFATE